MSWSLLAGDVVAVLGVSILTLSVVAIVRAPDANVKIHASSLAAMAGLGLVLVVPLLTGQFEIIARVLVVAGFSVLTTPLATYELARLALIAHRAERDR